MFRSQTDEQMAARWDPEPWVERDGKGHHSHFEGVKYTEGMNGCTFDPRIEMIPTRDPEPWHEGDQWFPGPRHAQSDPPGEDDVAEFDVRPEYARPPVNPILVAFRVWESPLNRANFIREVQALAVDPMRGWLLSDGITGAHLDHANAVLTRLGALA